MPDLTGWIDVDRPRLAGLGQAERVEYLVKRVELVAVNPLARILQTEIQPEPTSSATLIFGVAVCCAIEALGKFVNGGAGGNHDRFNAFLHVYMSGEFQSC